MKLIFFDFFDTPKKVDFWGGTCVVSVTPSKTGFLGSLRAVIEGRIEEKKKVRFPPKRRFGALFRVWGTFRGTLVWRGWRTPPCKKMARCRFPASGPKPGFLSETKKCASRFFHTVLILKEKNYTRRKKIYRNIFQKIIFY